MVMAGFATNNWFVGHLKRNNMRYHIPIKWIQSHWSWWIWLYVMRWKKRIHLLISVQQLALRWSVDAVDWKQILDIHSKMTSVNGLQKINWIPNECVFRFVEHGVYSWSKLAINWKRTDRFRITVFHSINSSNRSKSFIWPQQIHLSQRNPLESSMRTQCGHRAQISIKVDPATIFSLDRIEEFDSLLSSSIIKIWQNRDLSEVIFPISIQILNSPQASREMESQLNALLGAVKGHRLTRFKMSGHIANGINLALKWSWLGSQRTTGNKQLIFGSFETE